MRSNSEVGDGVAKNVNDAVRWSYIGEESFSREGNQRDAVKALNGIDWVSPSHSKAKRLPRMLRGESFPARDS